MHSEDKKRKRSKSKGSCTWLDKNRVGTTSRSERPERREGRRTKRKEEESSYEMDRSGDPSARDPREPWKFMQTTGQRHCEQTVDSCVISRLCWTFRVSAV